MSPNGTPCPPIDTVMLDAIGREVLRGAGEIWDELTPEQLEDERDNMRKWIEACWDAGFRVVPAGSAR